LRWLLDLHSGLVRRRMRRRKLLLVSGSNDGSITLGLHSLQRLLLGLDWLLLDFFRLRSFNRLLRLSWLYLWRLLSLRGLLKLLLLLRGAGFLHQLLLLNMLLLLVERRLLLLQLLLVLLRMLLLVVLEGCLLDGSCSQGRGSRQNNLVGERPRLRNSTRILLLLLVLGGNCLHRGGLSHDLLMNSAGDLVSAGRGDWQMRVAQVLECGSLVRRRRSLMLNHNDSRIHVRRLEVDLRVLKETELLLLLMRRGSTVLLGTDSCDSWSIAASWWWCWLVHVNRGDSALRRLGAADGGGRELLLLGLLLGL